MTLAKASVYVEGGDAAWLVAETPSEVAEMVDCSDPNDLLKLTLGNHSEWNGKPLYIRSGEVVAISPPHAQEDD